MKKTFIESRSIQTVDPTSGEVIITDTHKIHKVILEDEDRFFMVYFNMLKTFYQIKYIKDVLLLVKLAELANYNTGEVLIPTSTRQQLCEELEVSKPYISTAFKRLCDLGLLEGDKGRYKLNEAAFWKGDAKTRKQALKDKGLEFKIKFTIQ